MANTLKFGNGEWYGKKDTILAYNDENSNYKPLPFDFSRASKATVINKDGLIEEVGSGQPRVDYKDDSKGALKLEPSRTNIFQRSEEFSNAYWNISRIETPYIADVISPDGTLNAYTLEISNGETNGGGVYRSGISISGDNSWSVFAKKKTANYLVLADTSTTTNAAYFDLENGTVGTTYNATGEMQDFGNGWYRCTMKYTLTSSGIKFIYLSNLDGATNGGVQGGDSIYIYGAQLEQGTYPTSYIPTQGSAVTRLADSCSQTVPDGVIGQTEGVLYAEISQDNDSFNTISVSDGGTSDRITIVYQNNTIKSILVHNNNVVQLEKSGYLQNSFHKVAIKYTQSNVSLIINGLEVLTTSRGAFADSLNTLQFAQGNGGNNFYGKVKDVRVYNTALTDAELAALTQV